MAFGRYPSCSIARSTRSVFSGLTRAAPVSTRDTVGDETRANRATSAMVAGWSAGSEGMIVSPYGAAIMALT